MILRIALALFSLGQGTTSIDGPQTGTIHAEDGVRIAYTSEGQGDPAIIFVHGWTCDQTHWRFQVAEFRKSFRVITIDLPGHGASGANRESWSMDGLGADVAAVVRGLELKRVILVGHSMGGSVVLAAASKLRGIVQGIVAADSVHNVEYVARPDATARFIKRFEDDFEGARARFMSGFFENRDSEILQSILQDTSKTDPTAAVQQLADYNRYDLKAALSAAGVPVRAINAANPYPTAIKTNRKYGDFDAVFMKGVGHFLMLQKPDEFNRHLRTMIDQMRG